MTELMTVQKPIKKVHDSNIELFRVFLMLMIVAHHYVVNSGFTSLFDYSNITGNMIFLQFLGWGGKTGINCFLLITGFFMYTQFRFKKLLKLYLEVKFYCVIFYFIFLFTEYRTFSAGYFVFKVLFGVIGNLNGDFTGGFFALFLIFPFLNILINKMNKYQHMTLIGVLLVIYTISSTFFLNQNFEYLGWYLTVYLIGAFVGRYPCKMFENKKIWTWLSAAGLGLAWLSILAEDFIGMRFEQNGFNKWDFMFAGENKLLAIICGFCFFMLFKNIKIKRNKLINTVASSTFGVLLIHANSNEMRQFLWKDLLKNTTYYSSKYLVLHAAASIIEVYIICVLIDMIRINLLEKPLFHFIDKNSDYFNGKFVKLKEKMKNRIDKIIGD